MPCNGVYSVLSIFFLSIAVIWVAAVPAVQVNLSLYFLRVGELFREKRMGVRCAAYTAGHRARPRIGGCSRAGDETLIMDPSRWISRRFNHKPERSGLGVVPTVNERFRRNVQVVCRSARTRCGGTSTELPSQTSFQSISMIAVSRTIADASQRGFSRRFVLLSDVVRPPCVRFVFPFCPDSQPATFPPGSVPIELLL